VVGDRQVPYYVMEYIEGESLDHLIENRNALQPRMVAHVLDGVASALDEAHKKGIIHRDLKPGNIMLLPDSEHPGSWIPKLADFGLVKMKESVSDLTRTGAIMGSPHYMSPEQANGKPLTEKSDIYSLGVVVYEMITGARPFQNLNSTTQILVAHIEDAPPPLAMYNRQEIPTSVESVVLKALEKDPNDRFESAGEFAHAFRNALDGGDSQESPLPVREILIGAAALLLVLTVVWWFVLRPPTTRKLLKNAQQNLEREQYTEASELCEKVFVEDPENEVALNCMNEVADGFRESGDISSAKKVYNTVISKSPGDSRANLELGRILLSQGQYKDSITYLEKVVVPNSPADTWCDLAWAYYYARRYQDAIPVFNKLSNEKPIEAYKGLTLSYYALDWFKDALGAVVRWIELESTEPEPYWYSGLIYEELGELEKAKTAYERYVQLVEQEPENVVKASTRIAKVLFDMGKFEQAAEEFENLVELNSDNVETYMWLVRTHEALQQFDAMSRYAQRWMDLAPEKSDPYRAAGWALFYLQDYEKAIERFDQALAIHESKGAYYGLYNAHSSLRQYDHALEVAQSWVEFVPECVDAHNSVGWAFYNLERYESAILAFSKAVQLQDLPHAYQGLASAHYALRNYDLALSNVEKWISLSPEDARAYSQKGWCLFKLDRFEDATVAFLDSLEIEAHSAAYSGGVQAYNAQQEYEKALALSDSWITSEPDNANAYVTRGWAYVNLSDCGKAVEDFNRALELNTDLVRAQEGLQACPNQ
jgi:serine/threonine protein kinase/regulator of sirC expression with transglutaminase-like and TPR domain